MFNHGQMQRDFTYIDDIVEGVVRALDRVADGRPGMRSATAPDPATSNAPYRVYNIGNHQPVELLDFIEVLEAALGTQGRRRSCCRCSTATCRRPMPNVEALRDWVGFAPATPIEAGIGRFVAWYRDYYRV